MDHNMSMMSTMATATMAMMTPTGTAAAAATSAAMDMDGMGMGNGCKISMLWNWTTLDACFISPTWHVTSTAAFAGSCIGVVLLVMSLEFLRRLSREYNTFIIRQAIRQRGLSPVPTGVGEGGVQGQGTGKESPLTSVRSIAFGSGKRWVRPSLVQQTLRAVLHMLQFGVAYFIMLLAMYYNGYIIICILLGALLGSFVFSWEVLGLGGEEQGEATVCCG